MNADELRQAANTLRERAAGATPAPWDRVLGFSGIAVVSHAATEPVDVTSLIRDSNADFIATMHPGVGLALAKWLDDIAAGWMWDGEEPNVVDFDGDRLTFDGSMDTHPLALARLINGGVA